MPLTEPDQVVDLRSDTVTKPTPEMRRAMAEAEVGDDVFGEDPTVNRLEALAAERLGKEAGLFVVSGTMGNQASLMAQTQRGDEVILDESSHIFNYEVAALVVLSAVQPRTLRGHYGILDPEDIRRAVHSLRHTVGADLRKRGADIRDIQDVLRHADIGTTQIYTHMAREDLRKKLPRRFSG